MSPHSPASPEATFAEVLAGLDSTLTREASGLAAFERVAPCDPRLGDGVAYAREEVARALALSRQARTLLAHLVPVEAEVRALLAAHPLPSAEVPA